MPALSRPPNEGALLSVETRGPAPLWQQWFTNLWRNVAPSDHFYIPAASGVPTGTPEVRTGFVPMKFDTANNDLYVFDGSWIKVTLS